MLSTDRKDFEALLVPLCAGFNVPLADRPDAYWRGLQKMSLIEFSRVVDHALGEDGPDKIPTTKQCWSIRNQLRKPMRHEPAQPRVLPQRHGFWHSTVDGMFMRYLSRRRLTDRFRGDVNLLIRRVACKELWQFLEEHETEFGREITLEQDPQARFDRAMARIQDVSEDEGWLAAELHRQRLDDQGGLTS